MKKTKNFLITFLFLIVSALLSGILVNLFLYADLGSDSITIFADGLHHLLGIRVGVCTYMCNGMFIAAALMTAPKKLGWTTIIFPLLEGPAIDLMNDLMTAGWCMGGTIGIGSIAAVLFTGFLIDFFVKLLNHQNPFHFRILPQESMPLS